MPNEFENLKYNDFRHMALNPNLSLNEKIGFPEHYRQGYDEVIFNDIVEKLSKLKDKNCHVLDIGSGCSELPQLIIQHSRKYNHKLVLVDSQEMLSLLPNDDNLITKISGFYPDCQQEIINIGLKFDVILCYSVFHYIFIEASFWHFIDLSLELLAEGGQMLIGDIPNVSKRKRFFSSSNGIKFHQSFMKTTDVPEVNFRAIEFNKIDDSVILGVIMRARSQGCDAYWLPQPSVLPMYNRREDILIIKP